MKKKIESFLWFIELIFEMIAILMLRLVEIVCTSLGFTVLSEKIEAVIQKIWVNGLRIAKFNGMSSTDLEQSVRYWYKDDDLASFVKSEFEKYT